MNSPPAGAGRAAAGGRFARPGAVCRRRDRHYFLDHPAAQRRCPPRAASPRPDTAEDHADVFEYFDCSCHVASLICWMFYQQG